MNYHVNRNGQDLGAFTLEELQRRRALGEFNGTEQVRSEGMSAWQPLNSVIPPMPPRPASGVGLAAKKEKGTNPFLVGALFLGGFLVLAAVLGLVGYRLIVSPTVKRLTAELRNASRPASGRDSAMTAASKPVTVNSNALTEADVIKVQREFRIRQYLDGYKLRGQRHPECDARALGLLSNWIGWHFGGDFDTNLPSLTQLADQLADDPSCTDPMVLAVAADNTPELHQAVRRLERAVKGFENSQHLGYPKFYATELLAEKLIYDRADRLPVLDAQALQYLKAALTDGSLPPGDQQEIARLLVLGWGKRFFARNGAAVCALVQGQGEAYRWLALVLQGEHEINEAWRARGTGYANSVSDSGWQGFNQHLASARDALTRAWQLKPGWPLAPDRMITVSLGDSGIDEMRNWFDRTVAAQLDFSDAWKEMRWGLRPRWYGSTDAMLAFGVTALKTGRFDTDVPRMFIDSLYDVEAESDLSEGEHLYSRADIWPHLRELYEGYINLSHEDSWLRDGWRSSYAAIAYSAGKYDVARTQLQALNWRPHRLTDWGQDMSLMPEEVAARTGAEAQAVAAAEKARAAGDLAGALKAYRGLAALTTGDERTRRFIQERQYSLDAEQRLQSGAWIPFLPQDVHFTGWQTNLGACQLRPDGSLEVTADPDGHLLYSRIRVGADFEVRGQIEVISSTSEAFQAGLVMGLPETDTYNWYAFRIKHNPDEGDVASFSQHWTKRQILARLGNLNRRTNAFTFRFHDGRVSATVNGQEVFKDVEPPKNARVRTSEFLVGLGAFNDSNSTVIRYHDLELRSLANP